MRNQQGCWWCPLAEERPKAALSVTRLCLDTFQNAFALPGSSPVEGEIPKGFLKIFPEDDTAFHDEQQKSVPFPPAARPDM
ncbi:UNVERIFIED_CONTAM: hypothetical protein K2H54_057180 [Gekko kuhli]